MKTFVVLAVVIFLACRCPKASSLASTDCNMKYLGACHQYRAAGSHDIGSPKSPHIKFCQQECNSANCRLKCQVPISCQQNCAAGRCSVMHCEARSCSQSCTRSACQMDCAGAVCRQNCRLSGCNMTCSANAEKCFQTCDGGQCTMRCPAGVKVCQQTCKGGACVMLCDAKQCDRSCDGGKCTYDLKTRVGALASIETCRAVSVANTSRTSCHQECIGGNCALKYKYTKHLSAAQVCDGEGCSFSCKAPLQCRQICIGGRCIDFVCNSDTCVQECIGGNCDIQCAAKSCFQLCRGGGCAMNCPSDVDVCYQWCSGGGCQLTCSAQTCYPFCATGDCLTSNVRPQIHAISYTVRCAVGTGYCQHKCYQKRSCICRRYYSFSHSCKQICDEGSCRRMTCYMPGTCNQVCVEGECKRMVCRSKSCVQDCQGSNCKMECRSANCTQLCPGGACEMKCSPSTDICIQSCNSLAGPCKHECRAKKCIITML